MSSSAPPPRILIVEDDPGNALVMKTILVRLGGMRVEITEDGDRVLAQAPAVDLVLMDVSLSSTKVGGVPVDGLELTRHLKRLSDPPRVLLATAHAMRGDRERFLSESGADGYVAKPITDHAFFVETVRSLLREPR